MAALNVRFLKTNEGKIRLIDYTQLFNFTALWLGASDTASEGQFIWDSTGKKMVPGYVGWYPGYPQSACGTSTFDCAVYNTYQTLPAWVDDFCSDKLGGICELQPNH